MFCAKMSMKLTEKIYVTLSQKQETKIRENDMGTGVCRYIQRSLITKDPLYPMEIPDRSVTSRRLSSIYSHHCPTPTGRHVEFLQHVMGRCPRYNG
ncbi:hypothetical protein E2C01_009738 [Portunus trituberculatus]|uniref:Uncharacterized protein n=1 Tax=Portunus trituberculatus TaxID=210409 RepID=A0A5B7D6J7_PORTR|nr:hypothetical protein [Portunus trituberculatus]